MERVHKFDILNRRVDDFESDTVCQIIRGCFRVSPSYPAAKDERFSRSETEIEVDLSARQIYLVCLRMCGENMNTGFGYVLYEHSVILIDGYALSFQV